MSGLAFGLLIGFVGAYRMVTLTLREMARETARLQKQKKK